VKPGKDIDLMKTSPDESGYGWQPEDKAGIADKLAKNGHKLLNLQYKLYAENKQSLLIVLQAMDAGGKDGTINHVLYSMNPQGCRCQSFKVPSTLEASHDFIWREHIVAPHNGEVVIFNRSHYENVLVSRVHGNLDAKQLKLRYNIINGFEKLLENNRTTVVKFFLHISKDEQLKRFGDRLSAPEKHWKISENDYREREYWDAYMAAFNDAINHCTTESAPWFIIPADNKDFRNLAVSEILVRTLERMDPQIPAPSVNIAEITKLYHQNLLAAQQPIPAPAAPAPAVIEIKIKEKKDKKKKKKK